MSSNREYGKEKRSRKNKKQHRNVNDYETSHHFEQKVKRMFEKNKYDKYKRFDVEEDI
jgi:hypothetical protein